MSTAKALNGGGADVAPLAGLFAQAEGPKFEGTLDFSDILGGVGSKPDAKAPFGAPASPSASAPVPVARIRFNDGVAALALLAMVARPSLRWTAAAVAVVSMIRRK